MSLGDELGDQASFIKREGIIDKYCTKYNQKKVNFVRNDQDDLLYAE